MYRDVPDWCCFCDKTDLHSWPWIFVDDIPVGTYFGTLHIETGCTLDSIKVLG